MKAKLGVISDTHGHLANGVHDVFADVNYIIHAGDICSASVLWELESIAETIAVLGNCDRIDYGPGVGPSADKTICGVRIYVAHYPEDAVQAARSGSYALAIHGHTHVPRDITINGCRVVNPGSSTRPRDGSVACVAIVSIEDGAVREVRTVPVS